jgi:PAS domain S-box-containing protein
MLGYRAEELVGTQIHTLLPDTPAGKARSEEVGRKYLAGEPVSGWEVELRHKDDRSVWIQVWMEPTRGEDGSLQAARCFCIDVTDRVLAEPERDRLEQQNLYLQEEIKAEHDFEQLVGRSPALARVLADVGRVAPTDATVLIAGETGTGKELIARAVHSASQRRDNPLIKVNCAARPAGRVESELFGHERGAFSGAVARRPGRSELADGGTLVLDEVGELPLDAQAELLRALQERAFDRVGGAAPVRVDVRVIAATNRDLAADVRARRFREDLHYRLNVFPVRLPPLRERPDDVPLLVHFLVGKFARRRCGGCGSTRGRATSASWGTCWSAPSSWRVARPSTSGPTSSPPRGRPPPGGGPVRTTRRQTRPGPPRTDPSPAWRPWSGTTSSPSCGRPTG